VNTEPVGPAGTTSVNHQETLAQPVAPANVDCRFRNAELPNKIPRSAILIPELIWLRRTGRRRRQPVPPAI